MGQINSTQANPASLPEYAPATRAAGGIVNPASDAGGAPGDEMQFTKLSGVLNSLKKGASVMRGQVWQLMSAVRSGNYSVDPLQVSRSIVGESLALH